MAEKKMHEIIELGTAGCEYTGGGIWVAYQPIFADGKMMHIAYDSESYHNDNNTPEFTVFEDDGENGTLAQTMATEYGDDEECPGVFVHIKKGTHYHRLYKELRKAIKKALKTEQPFDSVPFE